MDPTPLVELFEGLAQQEIFSRGLYGPDTLLAAVLIGMIAIGGFLFFIASIRAPRRGVSRRFSLVGLLSVLLILLACGCFLFYDVTMPMPGGGPSGTENLLNNPIGPVIIVALIAFGLIIVTRG